MGVLGVVASQLGQAYLDRRAQERAFAQNQEFWHERFNTEAAYNHPVEQVNRLKEAGLNPALMYKQGAGGAGNISGPSAQGKVAEKYQLGELAKQSAEVALIKRQAEKVQSEADYVRSKTTGQGSLNETYAVDLAMKQIQKSYYTKYQKQGLQKLVNEVKKAANEADLVGNKADQARMEKELYKKVYWEASQKLGVDLNKDKMGIYMQLIYQSGGGLLKTLQEGLQYIDKGVTNFIPQFLK
jgi:hypothetical protein